MAQTAVIIGDGYVGKTCILQSLKEEHFSDNVPNIYEEFVTEESVNDKTFTIRFVDSAGQEEYNEIRKLTYRDAKIFLVCFAVDDQVSFENVRSKWIFDIEDYANLPRILVGSKSDLRKSNGSSCVTKSMIRTLQKELKAVCYIECSAKTRDGIKDLKRATVRALYDSEHKKNCVLQ